MFRVGRDCIAALLLLLLPAVAAAQMSGGALIGRVIDEARRPVGGVDVTVTHIAAGVSRTLKSGADGRYRFPSLQTGVYEIVAEHAGYATVSVRKVEVLLGVAQHVDIHLHHVTEEESLTITAPVRAVESGPAIGLVVGRELMADVPLRQRSISEIAALAPLAPAQIAETIVDGATAAAELPLDAVEEIHAVARQYPAEYGRTGGGALLVEARKGTNAFDGDAFALYRHRAATWQWGAAAGGPIVKDESHFFVAAGRNPEEPVRLFADANADLSSRHFVEGQFANHRDNFAARDVWLARDDLWNNLVVRAASGRNEFRETLAGSTEGTSVRHDWTAGALSLQNGGNGYFLQDQVVVRKWVVGAGLRYDTGSGFSPRFGLTYDVNGSGRNLLRASFGRYRHPDSTTASLGYSWQVNPWVALNVDALHGDRRAVAVSGLVAFGTFVSLTGSYTYSDRVDAMSPSRHSATVAGTVHLPVGFWISGIGRYRSASEGAGRVAGTDLRVARTWTLECGIAIDAVADLFNAFGQYRRVPGNERSEQFGFRVNF